jgi:two-component system sensor histidine kinase CpxA
VRSLYLRVFVVIGLTTMLIVGISVLVSFQVMNRWIETADEIRPNEMIAEASRQLATGGEPALVEWLREQERSATRAVLLVIDGQGRELLGRQIPPPLERRMRRMREWGQSPRPQNLRPPFLMPRIVGSGGNEYHVVPAPRQLGPLGLFGVATVRHLILALALLITAAVSFLLARSISAPVRGLRDASRALAAGRLEERVAPAISARRDELGSLGRDFDHMASRLQALMASRQELLRNVSHELRTPLTRIRMAVELARDSDGDDTKELERVILETEKLDQLIGQVLALARVDHGAPAASHRRLDLSALVGSLVEEAEMEADAAGVTLTPRIARGISIEGDASLLAAAIENIIRNALRYTPDGAAVDVTLEPAEPGAVLRVRDRGPGVPEGELPRIFEPFHQVASARSPEERGYGLGLAVTAGAARLHGGSVAARNHPEGGLEVTLTLGRTPAAA